jgi:O-methyltransferase
MTDATRRWIESIAPLKLGYIETLCMTYTLARHVIDSGIPGDFVECGVFCGVECAVMARALKDAGADDGRRIVHLFDSFRGIPEPGPEDHEFVAAGTRSGGAACSLSEVHQHMSDFGIPDNLLAYHPGWFFDTLPNSGIKQIALLRLDADLYESTRDCLKWLYPLVPRGGIVIVDDYPLSGCRKALHEVVYPQPVYFQRLP